MSILLAEDKNWALKDPTTVKSFSKSFEFQTLGPSHTGLETGKGFPGNCSLLAEKITQSVGELLQAIAEWNANIHQKLTKKRKENIHLQSKAFTL